MTDDTRPCVLVLGMPPPGPRNSIVTACREEGFTITFWQAEIWDDDTHPQYYEHRLLAVRDVAVVIVYIGEPTAGVGITMEMAHRNGIPILIVIERYEKAVRAFDALVVGHPGVKQIVSFSELDELKLALRKSFEETLPPRLSSQK